MFMANHFILFLLDVCNAIIALFIVLYWILISQCLFIYFFFSRILVSQLQRIKEIEK